MSNTSSTTSKTKIADLRDTHINVRGVMVPKERLDEIEQELGARVVPNHEADLLTALDRFMAEYFLKNGLRYPPNRTVVINTDRYVFRNFELFGLEAGGIKKMWFRSRRPI